MIKTALYCRKCEDVIISRTRHDFNRCKCLDVAIDGGHEYMRVCYETDADYQVIDIDLPYTSEELYQDWNSRRDKLDRFKLDKVKVVEKK